MMNGMDLKLIESTHKLTNLPIVYLRWKGSIADISQAFTFDISGVSAGSFCFYGPHKAVLISYPHEEKKIYD